MAYDELTKVNSTFLVCDQTGDCGELIDLDVGKGSGTFVSQTTGGVVEFSDGDVVVADVSIDNLDRLIKESALDQKQVGIWLSKPQHQSMILNDESIEHFLTQETENFFLQAQLGFINTQFADRFSKHSLAGVNGGYISSIRNAPTLAKALTNAAVTSLEVYYTNELMKEIDRMYRRKVDEGKIK